MTPAIGLHWFYVPDRDPPDSVLTLLNAAERARAERLRVAHPRRVFLYARAALRWTLGQATGRPPEEVRIVSGIHGKPGFDTTDGPGFNLSHSGGTVVIAVAAGLDVGVDVEEVRGSVRTLELARRFFKPRESAEVEAVQEGPERWRVFYHYWTAKEAVLKATGSGLTVPVRSVEVSGDPEVRPRVLSIGDDPGAAAQWWLWRFEIPGAWIATVAAQAGQDRALQAREFPIRQL